MRGTFGGLVIGAAMAVSVLLGQPGAVDAQSHAASRKFLVNWASPGSEMTVTISAREYGPFGQVVETLPLGFSYVRSSLDANDVDREGRTLRFTLFGVSNFSYVVKVPGTDGQYTFSGTIKNSDREERTIAGDTQLRIGPAPTPTSVPTPTVTPTPTPSPTPTATPIPTATPTPTITPIPTPTPTETPVPTSTPDIEATVEVRVAAALATAVASTPTVEATTLTATTPDQPGKSDAYSSSFSALLIGIAITAFVAGFVAGFIAFRRRRF